MVRSKQDHGRDPDDQIYPHTLSIFIRDTRDEVNNSKWCRDGERKAKCIEYARLSLGGGAGEGIKNRRLDMSDSHLRAHT